MSGFQPTLDFEAANTAAEDGDALVIDIDGYEGPLHVLLALARNQKVDLLQLSITKLADQYLSFVQQARRVRFSLAADYLVMAAWLTYLKSRLLLPRPLVYSVRLNSLGAVLPASTAASVSLRRVWVLLAPVISKLRRACRPSHWVRS